MLVNLGGMHVYIHSKNSFNFAVELEIYLGEMMSCAKMENKEKVYGLEFMKFAELWYDVRNKLRLLNLTGDRG